MGGCGRPKEDRGRLREALSGSAVVAIVVADTEAFWRRSRLAPPRHDRGARASTAGRALGVFFTTDSTPQVVSEDAIADTTA